MPLSGVKVPDRLSLFGSGWGSSRERPRQASEATRRARAARPRFSAARPCGRPPGPLLPISAQGGRGPWPPGRGASTTAFLGRPPARAEHRLPEAKSSPKRGPCARGRRRYGAGRGAALYHAMWKIGMTGVSMPSVLARTCAWAGARACVGALEWPASYAPEPLLRTRHWQDRCSNCETQELRACVHKSGQTCIALIRLSSACACMCEVDERGRKRQCAQTKTSNSHSRNNMLIFRFEPPPLAHDAANEPHPKCECQCHTISFSYSYVHRLHA